MTQASTPTGLFFPDPALYVAGSNVLATMDAATEKVAMIGRLYIAGRPGGTKTLSTGTIQWRAGTSTFAAAAGGSTLDIGIQDVATGAGPIAQPDGTFDVKKTLVSATDTVSSAAWNTTTMATGSKSMAHGDLIAVVFDMTARTAPDSVIVTLGNSMVSTGTFATFPVTNAYVSSAWQTTSAAGAARVPNVIIVFDDGTLGWIDGGQPFTTASNNDTFQDTTDPDERGMLFQVPWACKVDALWMVGGVTDASADFSMKLYSAPTTAPSALSTQTMLAENLGVAAASGFVLIPLPAEISLSANTDYAVTLRATGSSNVRLNNFVLGNTAHRATLPGTTTLAKVTRKDNTGNFTAESPAITMYGIGVRISSFDDGTGSGGGGGNTVFGGLGGVIV